ncbi:hypothetical protein EVAR_75996_1 [Eumeta japonica]|uniref:Uncharacterized protein n=1 Tax=Eumeta variegata TaxID=151549 RepID=A0A4C1UA15_EUMVA|nr:hypothetical protein EVAR_75996_1 [Eumeta japonica]
MNDDELISRRKKQNADRVRAYRKRKKDLGAMPSTSTVQSAGVKLVAKASQWRKIGTRGRRKGRYTLNLRITSFAANSERQTFVPTNNELVIALHKQTTPARARPDNAGPNRRLQRSGVYGAASHGERRPPVAGGHSFRILSLSSYNGYGPRARLPKLLLGTRLWRIIKWF